MSSASIPPTCTREWAESYLAAGLKPIPLHPGTKRPLIDWGPYQTDIPLLDELDLWWTDHDERGIATVLAGTPFCVVDLDGPEALPLLRATWGLAPAQDQPISQSARGFHCWFRQQGAALIGQTVIKVVTAGDSGIDLLAGDRLVILPPSLHPAGPTYRWLVPFRPDCVPVLPDVIAQTWRAHATREPAPGDAPIDGPIPEGQREATLVRILGGARRQGATPHELRALAEALNARCDPRLSDHDLDRLARSVGRYAPEPDVEADVLGQIPDTAPAEPKPVSVFVTARQLLSQTGAEIACVTGPYLVAGAVTELLAPPKKGKTRLRNFWIRCVLDGLLGLDGLPSEQGPVVLLTEEGLAALQEGLYAAGLHHRDTLHILTAHAGRGLTWADMLREATALAVRVSARLLVSDTTPAVARVGSDGENDAGIAAAVMREFDQATATGLAVLSLRHARKSGGALVDLGRGSNGWTGAADVIVGLSHPREGRPTVRVLEAIGRFNHIPERRVIERVLVDGIEHYAIVSDDDTGGTTETPAQRVFAALPWTADEALSRATLARLLDCNEKTVGRALDALGDRVATVPGGGSVATRYHRAGGRDDG